MPAIKDLSGRRFGKLTVIKRIGTSSYGQPKWFCVCDCGITKEVFGNSLRSGATLSCGCLHRQRVTKHGKTGTREFTSWQQMLQRCYNPRHANYKDYGARGITVCERWRSSFATFLTDIGPRPSGTSLDRYPNNNGNYEPTNCRWASPLKQGQNKRNNRILELDGTRRTLGEWCRLLKLPKSTVLNRLYRGASIEQSLATAPTRCSKSLRQSDHLKT